MAWDREYPGLREKLEQVRALGVKDALLGNLGMFPIAREPVSYTHLAENMRGFPCNTKHKEASACA